jgi:hypothetical protein
LILKPSNSIVPDSPRLTFRSRARDGPRLNAMMRTNTIWRTVNQTVSAAL